MEITLRDVYEAQLKTAEAVALIAGEMKQLTARVDERLETGQRKMDDHEQRLRHIEAAVPTDIETRVTALEKMAWKMVGAFAAINALAVVIEWILLNRK